MLLTFYVLYFKQRALSHVVVFKATVINEILLDLNCESDRLIMGFSYHVKNINNKQVAYIIIEDICWFW